MKYLILTTYEPALKWSTLDAKRKAILTALRLGKGGEAWETVDVKYVNVKPIVHSDRIDRWWLENLCKPYFSQGYDMISLHSSEGQWKEWGIKGIRGANPNDNLEMESMYFSADENTLRNGLNRFIQVCLHETSHGAYDKLGGVDRTHEYHDKNKDITGLFVTFDWNKYQPLRRKLRQLRDTLQDKLNLLLVKESLEHPVPKQFRQVTQPYGVKNPIYKQTGHHIGTDWRTPVGTLLTAPIDGTITVSSSSPVLGNYCHFEYTYKGKKYIERWIHLDKKPTLGFYKKGQVCAYTGNTGLSTGPHLHQDIWENKVNVPILTPSNYQQYTIDPEKHYGLK